jgi:hypothetical protein
MVVGAFVRGLSMRDVESLPARRPASASSRVDRVKDLLELRERFEAFKRRDLYDQLVARFLDAIFLNVRPRGRRRRALRLGLYRGGRSGPGRGLASDASRTRTGLRVAAVIPAASPAPMLSSSPTARPV